MPEAYIIDSVWLGILGGLGGLLLAIVGWIARAFWKRLDQRDARMDRNKAEVLDLIKESAKRSEERFRAASAQLEKLCAKLDGNYE